MKATIKRKWLKALRSGNYVQTTGALRRTAQVGSEPVGYCCLGVLLDVVEPTRWKKRSAYGCLGHKDTAYVDPLGFLSPAFRQRFDMDDLHTHKLAQLNDAGDSFEVIADYIEAYL